MTIAAVSTAVVGGVAAFALIGGPTASLTGGSMAGCNSYSNGYLWTHNGTVYASHVNGGGTHSGSVHHHTCKSFSGTYYWSVTAYHNH